MFEGLDPDQAEAVFSPARHMLVAAGPGSGKTRVLASRYVYLIEKGFMPESLLAVTFTNRAALEMGKRVAMLTGLEASSFPIGTFHSFCLKFLKKQSPGFRLYTRGDQLLILKELGAKNPAKAIESISTAKNLLFSGFYSESKSPDGIFTAYQKALNKRDALDLDDLILETIRLLEERPTLLHSFFSHLLVDEYQDINPPQAYLIKKLVAGKGGGQGPGLFAIGDPDQSIYSFRGANLRGFFDFQDTYPGCEVRTLGRNYRSTGNIVSASKALIENNRLRMDGDRRVIAGEGMRPIRDEGEPIGVVECRNEKAEAEFVLKQIETIMGGLSSRTVGVGHGDGYRFSDFAVLIRTNRQVAAVEEVFSSSSIPFQVIGPPPDLQGFTEHIRGLGLPPDMQLGSFIKKEGESFGVDSVLLSSLVNTAGSLFGSMDREDGLGAFIEHLCLMQPPDTYDIEADRVAVMTLHMAKGLEFPVVFICGVEDGLLPLKMKGKQVDIEEERRLFYVGITRAKDRLYLLSTQRRRLWGEVFEPGKSPFLSELPENCIKKITFERKRPKRRPVQKGLFE
jgi:DNA helicase-2/ATP-dependent DNA helicase PcrA